MENKDKGNKNFEDITGLYELSKTLRFELKPVHYRDKNHEDNINFEKTKQWMNKKYFNLEEKELSKEERELKTFDPENEIALYLQAMANGHVFDLKKDPSEQLSGSESVEDILRLAINAEKDSIVFYLGLKAFVPVTAGKDKVEAIITEAPSRICEPI